jgi:hypothetical protein
MTRNNGSSSHRIVRELNFVRGTQQVIYVAVPLSSGLRLWEVAAEHGLSDPTQVRRRFRAEYESRVWRPNMEDAHKAFTRAARLFPEGCIINPAKLSVRGWSQEQYRRAWKTFISQFVDTVLVSDGWAYSHGCVAEVLHALKIHLRVVDMANRTMSREDVRDELNRARAKATEMGLHVWFLARVIKAPKVLIPEHKSEPVSRF